LVAEDQATFDVTAFDAWKDDGFEECEAEGVRRAENVLGLQGREHL
jgi:hypothetical protein